MYDVFITVGTDEGVASRAITVTVAKILSDGGFGYYDETAKNPASLKTPCEAHEAFDHFANLESPNRQHFHNFIGKYLDQLQVEKGLVAVQLGRRSDHYIRQVIIEVKLLKGTYSSIVVTRYPKGAEKETMTPLQTSALRLWIRRSGLL
jgi:hypothetical protein